MRLHLYFLLLVLVLCPSRGMAADATNLYSQANGSEGPAWLKVTLHSDVSNELWTISKAALTYDRGGELVTVSVRDEVIRAQSFVVQPEAEEFDIVYQIPRSVFELDQTQLQMSLTFSTNTEKSVGPVTSNFDSVDFKALRELRWQRIPGDQETVATFTPGSYLTHDFFGAGLKARLGVALNMGMVEVSLNDNVLMDSLDLFPTDLPVGSTNVAPPNTRYEQFSLMETQEENGAHRIKLTLLPERNERAVDTGLSLTSFDVERYAGNTQRINEYYLPTSTANVLLFSAPEPYDGNLLMTQLGFSSNWLEFVPEEDIVSDNVSTGDNLTVGSGNALTGSDNLTSTDNTTSTGNTTASDNLLGNPNGKASMSELFQRPKPTAGTKIYLFSISDGSALRSYTTTDPNALTIPLLKSDQLHRMEIHVLSPMGEGLSSGPYYRSSLESPLLWPAGQSSFSHASLGPLTLQREDVSKNWEIGLVDHSGLVDGNQYELILCVRAQNNASADIAFSILGLQDRVKNLDQNLEILPSSTGQAQLSKGSHIALPLGWRSSASTAATPSNGAGAITSGGGGGCLLQ